MSKQGFEINRSNDAQVLSIAYLDIHIPIRQSEKVLFNKGPLRLWLLVFERLSQNTIEKRK